MRGFNARLQLVDRPFGRTDRYDRQAPAAKLFALTVSEHGRPRVFEYEQTEDGLDGLMNLLQSEDVVAVIAGQQLPFKAESRVVLSVGGRPLEQSTLLRQG